VETLNNPERMFNDLGYFSAFGEAFYLRIFGA